MAQRLVVPIYIYMCVCVSYIYIYTREAFLSETGFEKVFRTLGPSEQTVL